MAPVMTKEEHYLAGFSLLMHMFVLLFRMVYTMNAF